MSDLSNIVGATITEVRGFEVGSNLVILILDDGRRVSFYHEQDCCENVSLYDIDGEPEDLVGGLIINAEEATGAIHELMEEAATDKLDNYDSITWTFYKVDTNKGGVWMRWLGESNGYYSEEVTVSIS